MFNSKFNRLTNFLSYQIKGRTISIVGSQLEPASSKEILLSKIWLVNSRSLNRPRPLRKNSNRKYQEIINGCQYRLPFCPRHLCRNKISKISSKCLLHLKRHQFEHQQFKRYFFQMIYMLCLKLIMFLRTIRSICKLYN